MAETQDLPLWKKLGWFIALWVGGVVTLTLAVFILKALIPGV